jgi:hypothetical protein
MSQLCAGEPVGALPPSERRSLPGLGNGKEHRGGTNSNSYDRSVVLPQTARHEHGHRDKD